MKVQPAPEPPACMHALASSWEGPKPKKPIRQRTMQTIHTQMAAILVPGCGSDGVGTVFFSTTSFSTTFFSKVGFSWLDACRNANAHASTDCEASFSFSPLDS